MISVFQARTGHVFSPAIEPAQGDLFAGGGDRFADRLARLLNRTTVFASGLSRARDFQAAAWSEHAIGVEIGELSLASMDALARTIIDYGAECFLDTGAFGAFKRGLRTGRPASLDFQQILKGYDAFLDVLADQNPAEQEHPIPLMVMPDVVGDQAASLRLLIEHRRWIAASCHTRLCRPIVPVQKGELTAAQAYAQAVQTLGTDDFIVGVPSNAAAFSGEELRAFLQAARPRAVHILGAFAPSRLSRRLAQVVRADLDNEIRVTADGNPLRSLIIATGQGAENRRDRLSRILGKPARQREYARLLKHHGGEHGLDRFLLEAPLDIQRRYLRALAWMFDETTQLPSETANGSPARSSGPG